MSGLIAKFTSLPAYGIAAIVVIVLYALQSEVRFGKRARTIRAGSDDRHSTLAVSVSAAVPFFGFALAVKADSPTFVPLLPSFFYLAKLPGMPAVAWLGVGLGACGLALRLWAVLTLRERYTRTLLIQDQHLVERGGPYRWVRHPGYLGSLLALNGVATASGNWLVLALSLVATLTAYLHRVRAEDRMLVDALGAPYVEYQRQVRALLPIARR